MLTVCVSASEQDWTTTGAVMRELFGSTTTGNFATTGEQDRLSDLIRRASAWAESYVGFPLALQVYSESLPASGGRRLMLSRTPLVKVLRLFDSTATCDATMYCSSEYLIEDRVAGFLARDRGFAWTAIEYTTAGDFSLGLTGALLPGMERRRWLAEYAAGYFAVGTTSSTDRGLTTGDENWTTGRTLPYDIEQAVIEKVGQWWARSEGVASRRVGDLAIDYRSEGPGPAERLLERYRRWE